MKKALIVLLILAVAGGLFAQSFSGSVTTGALFTFDGDMPVAANDDDGHAVKSRLTFTNGGDDWGLGIGVNADVTTANVVDGQNIGDMYGWVKFADIFKLTAGKGQGGNWQATDWIDNQIGGSNAGARLNITPIDGLDFGVVFGYPKHGVAANKIENFFQETGIGAKFDAGVVVVGTQIELFSEETYAAGMDANWWFDAKLPNLAGLFTIHIDGYIFNLTEKGGVMDKLIGLKIEGNVVGLGWNIWTKLAPNDTTTATAGGGLSYGIPISDKANVDLGAEAGLTLMDKFSFDTWNVSAKLTYNFNGNVSTSFKLKVDGDLNAETTIPTLLWNIKYSW